MAVATTLSSIELPKPTAEEIELEFLPYFQTAYLTAPYLGEIYDWAKDNVILPPAYSPPGKFDVNISPYLIDVFKAIRDPTIRQVNVMAPPRSGKTLLGEIVLLYLISNSPGNILWIQSTEPQMKKMSDARMSKLLRLCPPVAKLIDENDRYAVTQKKYRFANGIEVHLASATIKSLQSFGYKYIVFDECWLADTGLIAEAQARIGDFPNTYKIILISQGGSLRFPDWELEFNRAPIKEYGFKCPKCHQEQLYEFYKRLIKDKDWGGLFWPRNDKTYLGGEWQIQDTAKLAVIKCVHCKHYIQDTPDNRDYLEKNSLYLTTKTGGDTTKVSFRVNALAIRKVAFETLAKEWLEADAVDKATGDKTLKEVFWQKRMAQTPGTQKTLPILDLRVFNLPDGETWKDNTARFLSVDVQAKAPRFWWLIREWAGDGDSRKIAHGQAHTWQELAQVRKLHKVPVSSVLVDSGHATDEVYTQCTIAEDSAWGAYRGGKVWFCYTACRGSGLYNFKENDNKPFKIETQRPNIGNDPKYRGVPGCPYVVWSNPRIKRVLEHLRDGKGAKWLSNDNDPEYQKQLVSEIAIKRSNGFQYVKVNENEPNEYWDLEALQVLAAIMSGRLNVVPTQQLAIEEAVKEKAERN